MSETVSLVVVYLHLSC